MTAWWKNSVKRKGLKAARASSTQRLQKSRFSARIEESLEKYLRGNGNGDGVRAKA